MAQYYVSNSGNDNYNGLSPSAPFRTLAYVKVLGKLGKFKAGDVISLKCGDEFYEQLPAIWPDPYNESLARDLSDPYVTFGKYGFGQRPLVSCFQCILPTSWISHAPNVWKVDLKDKSKIYGFKEDLGDREANIGFMLVDGVIHGVKRWSIDELSSEWDFYSDNTQWLYVYSAINPSVAAGEIKAAPNWNLMALSPATRVTGLEFFGSGGHWFTNSCQGFDAKGNWVHGVGGSRLMGTTRYGNGVQFWSQSKDANVELNVIWDVYDAATTLQGDNVTSGWENISIRHNIFFNSNQFFELWSKGTSEDEDDIPEDGGFKKVFFENNICIYAGNGWSSEIRPDKSTRAPLLLYPMRAPINDISVKKNIFYGAKDNLIYKSEDGTGIPDGYKLEDNYVYLRRNQKVFNQLSVVASDFDEFIKLTGTGHGCSVVYIDDESEDVETVLEQLASQAGMNTAYTELLSNALSEVVSQVSELRDSMFLSRVAKCDTRRHTFELPVRGAGYASIVGGYVTNSTAANEDKYAKLLTVEITNGFARFDLMMAYSMGQDSSPNRNGVGFVNIQISPSSHLDSAYVDLDVMQLLPFSQGVMVEDFAAVTTVSDGSKVVVEFYFNIGRDNYSELGYQPIILNTNETGVVQYEFHNKAGLVAELPDGVQKVGSSLSAPFISEPQKGNGAPTSTPDYDGQDYMDKQNKKAYKAFGNSSASDWVPLN